MWTVHVVRKFHTQYEAEAFADSMMNTALSPKDTYVELQEDAPVKSDH